MQSRKSIRLGAYEEKEQIFDFNHMNNLINLVPENCKFLIEHEILSKKILIKKEVIVRVYILRLEKLANRDTGFFEGGEQGISDPYIKIYLTNDDKDNVPQGDDKSHLENKKDCDWCKHYE